MYEFNLSNFLADMGNVLWGVRTIILNYLVRTFLKVRNDNKCDKIIFNQK